MTQTLYCSTQNVLDFDPSSAYLCATPEAPDFDLQIGFVSEEIDTILRNTYPRIDASDLEDVTQLKLICIHGTLAILYRSAVLHKGSSAQFAADEHRKEFQALLKMRLDLVSGETVKPGVGRLLRS